MKNIALLHYSCPPVVGGVEEVVRQQAALFHRHFHPVKVFAGQGSGFAAGIPVEINPRLGSQHPEISRLQEGAAANWPAIKEMAAELTAYLEKQLASFDVLIAHNVLSMPYNLPLTLALHQLAGRPQPRIIAWNHDSPYFYREKREFYDRDPWRILRTWNPRITYTTISPQREAEFRELYGADKPLKMVPNGIDPYRFFRLDPSTARLLAEQQLLQAELIMLQPCRLHPRKNVELSIEVLAAIRKKGIDARLLLTGAGDPHEPSTVAYHQQLRQLAERLGVDGQVIFAADYRFASGERLTPDRVTVRDLYLIADLLFMPSKIEGFGIPLLEAGMIKLPIACSDIPTFSAIAGHDALVFSLAEPAAVIGDRVLAFLEKLPTHGMYRRVIRHYVWDNIYQHYILPLFN